MAEERRYVYVYNQTKESFLAYRVKVADSVLGRLVGLLGKRSVEPGGGVWIVPCNSIHTVGMVFPIDVVLVDKKFRVVGLREMLRPFSVIRPNFRAESVIELASHAIFRSGTAVGDELVIERYEPNRWPGNAETSAGVNPNESAGIERQSTRHRKETADDDRRASLSIVQPMRKWVAK